MVTPSRLALVTCLSLAAAAGALLVVDVAPAEASHYRFEQIELVTPDERDALARAGVRDTRALLARAYNHAGRLRLVQATGLPYARIEALATQCDLLRIEGVGPSIMTVIQQAGVQDSRALAREVPEPLLDRLRVAARGTSMQSRMPDPDTLATWIRDARRSRSRLDVPEAPATAPVIDL